MINVITMLFGFLKRNFKFLFCYFLTTQVSFASSEVPAVWNLPTFNEYFVGREIELKNLNSLILDHQKVVIIGPSGVGKTQLAKKYAFNRSEEYDIVWWFDASKDMDDQYHDLIEYLNRTDADINKKIHTNAAASYAKNFLRATNKKWLLIFDNVKDFGDINEYFPEIHKKRFHHIIITSQNQNNSIKCLELKKFLPIEAKKFLFNILGEVEEKQIENLATILDFYPISLAQSAAYIKVNNMKIKDYIRLYDDYSTKLLREDSIHKTTYHYFDLKQPIYNTIDLLLRDVKNVSPNAYKILQLIVLSENIGIPSYVLVKVFNYNRNFHYYDLMDALRILRQYSLLIEVTKGENTYYSTHDLIKRFMRESINEEIYLSLLKATKSVFNKDWGENIDFINQNPDFITFADDIVFKAYKKGIKNELMVDLMISLLENNNLLFHKNSNYNKFQMISNILKEIDIEGLNVNHYIIARYYFNSIYADWIYQNEENTKSYNIKLLDSLNKIESDEKNLNLRFLGYIYVSQFYLFTGNLNESLIKLNKAKEILNLIHDDNYTALFYYTSTWVLIENGKYNQAYDIAKEFINITNEHLSGSVIHLFALNMMANLEYRKNNISKSLLLANQAYTKAKFYYQNKDKDIVAESLVTIARCYLKEKKLMLAKSNIEKALSIYEIVFGGKDIDFSQASAHMLLGKIYETEKKYDKALSNYKIAENFYTKILKGRMDELYEVSELYANIAILGIKIGDSNLYKNYLRKLNTYYEPNNENLIKALNYAKIQ